MRPAGGGDSACAQRQDNSPIFRREGARGGPKGLLVWTAWIAKDKSVHKTGCGRPSYPQGPAVIHRLGESYPQLWMYFQARGVPFKGLPLRSPPNIPLPGRGPGLRNLLDPWPQPGLELRPLPAKPPPNGFAPGAARSVQPGPWPGGCMTPTPTVADRFTRDSGIRPSAQGLFKVGVMCGLDPSQASIRRVVRPAEPAQSLP